MIVKPSRRSFLKGLSATGIAAGLSAGAASLLRLAESRANFGVSPLRFLFVYTSAGRDSNSMCSGTGAQFQFGEGLAPLEAIRDKVLVLDGIRIPEHTGEEHPCGRSSMLTASPAASSSLATAISFDRFLADRVANGESLYTGLQHPGGDIDLPISWLAANTPNENFLAGPATLLEHLCPGGVTSSEGQPVSAGPDEDEVALNRYLTREVERFMQVAPEADTDQVALHLKTLEQLRADVSGGGISRSCEALATESNDDEGDRLARVVVHGLACGRTSVAVLRVGTEEPHHEWSHWHDGADFREKLRALDLEEAGRFTRIVQLLDSYPEDGGTLLDNTIVVWSSEVSGGYDEDIHGTNNMPFILAGGGNRLKLGQRVVANGRSNAQLYRAIAHVMGLQDALAFGSPSLGTGLLEDILS
jgi:hypothetical protein